MPTTRSPRSPGQLPAHASPRGLVDHGFVPIRAKLIEVAAFLDRVEDFRLAPGKNQLRHVPNFYLRCLKELHIEFTPKKRVAG